MPGKKGKKGKDVETTKTSSSAATQESFQTIAAANSRLWETRVGIAETSRNEYRECVQRLTVENERLSKLVIQNEKDTVEVITFLKEKLTEKQKLLDDELEKSRSFRKTSGQEKEAMVIDFTKRIRDLEGELKSRNEQISTIKDEIKFAHDFRRKRNEMQQDITDLKNTIANVNRLHRDEQSHIEKKFLIQKVQIEKQSKNRIEELTAKIHREAVANLDQATKNVFKENVRLKEALNLEVKHEEVLKKAHEDVLVDNYKLREEVKNNYMALKGKIGQNKQEKQQLATYKDKITTLENSLTHVVREFDIERDKKASGGHREPSAINVELVKLQRMIELKTKEMAKIKRLAKSILDQRTELEHFFMSALDHVKSEIAKDQSCLRRRQIGNTSFAVFEDIKQVDRHLDLNAKIDIGDLSWSQKEGVLRHLFAKMNGSSKTGKVASAPSHQTPQQDREGSDAQTFITQPCPPK